MRIISSAKVLKMAEGLDVLDVLAVTGAGTVNGLSPLIGLALPA